MKKLLVCFALLLLAAGAKAQNGFNRGDWFLGAQSTSLGFNRSFGKDVPTKTEVNFDLTGGWFFSDRFALDALAGYSYVGYDKKSGYSLSDFTVGVGMRYYPVGNLFARVGYKGYATSVSNFMSSVEAKVGYDLFLSKKVFFEPAVYFEKNVNKHVLRRGRDVLGLSVGIGVKF